MRTCWFIMRFSNNVGCPKVAMVLKARPRIPLFGYPSKSCDSVSTRPIVWFVTVNPAMDTVSCPIVPSTLPAP